MQSKAIELLLRMTEEQLQEAIMKLKQLAQEPSD